MSEDKAIAFVNIRVTSGTQANHVIEDTEERIKWVEGELNRLQQQNRIYGFFFQKIGKQTTVNDYMNWLKSQKII